VSDYAFYTVADSGYFPGAVALLNSLRLLGHEQPLTVLDCGLEPRQRELLEPHVSLVEAPGGPLPALLKWYAPGQQPAEVMAHLDADIIVVRPLDDLLERARCGRIVAFRDWETRFFPEWESELGLRPLRRQRYVNSGFVVLPADPGIALMKRISALLEKVDPSRTQWASDERVKAESPFYLSDQDVLNALLGADPAGELVDVVDLGLLSFPTRQGDFEGLRLRDKRTLECRLNGRVPYLLHHWGPRKPWKDRLPSTPFSILMSRLLFWDDVRLRLDPRDLPRSLRPGALADASRRIRLHTGRARGKTARALLRYRAQARAGIRDPRGVLRDLLDRAR
jgi:hypothetical protein